MQYAARSKAVARAGRADPAVVDELGLTVYDVACDLRRDVVGVSLPLPIAGAREAADSRDRLIAQLDEHLLPRLRELSSPAIVVIAGSTGAGKSTLYNSLLGEEISPAGVLRPTTREPVLAFNPHDKDVVHEGPATKASRVVYPAGVPRATALLDAPDLDSFVEENRSTAQQLLEAADLWLFVTTAARYGDALPWQALTRSTERGASVAMVLNRVLPEAVATIRTDLMGRLREHGMTDVPLFVIPDIGPHEGLLEVEAVEAVRRWLYLLAGPERARAVIVRTLKGALDALPAWVTSLADAVDAQGAAARDIRAAVEGEREASRQRARELITSGETAGGIDARWRELSGLTRIERVRVRKGIARSMARAGRKREAALRGLRTGVEGSVQRALIAVGAATDARLRDLLGEGSGPAGGSAVLPDARERMAAREHAVADAVAQWSGEASDAVALLSNPTAPSDVADGSDPAAWQDVAARARGAVKAFGTHGLGSLLLCAAAGGFDARRLVDRVLGTTVAIDVLHDDLADRAARIADAEHDAFLAALDSAAFDEDASASLRIRLGELRRLT
jgi:energy-coupling factor transporter ATP-binding protein EcfA2